ncbi:PQQ-binding-like beta-propeller repeat protein [Halospeciosus flavus]|uniref:PQQ-binding-like beta-propeller repeat protein n=1 Tax=Halospeciosus flavus TaxID=3032283 RepID=A0ABD5Z877_9EURY|nr:PQQ-binding-like beta-propeller repeat protein [Halospeciosus flavus]
MDVADGSLQWDRRFEPATVDCRTSGEKRQCARWFTVDAVAGGTLVAAVRRYDDEPDSLLTLDARDGSVQWRDTLADAGMSLTKPVVAGQVLYVGVDREEGAASELRRYDLRDGTRVSTTPLSGSLAGDPVVAEERILLPLRTALVCLA